MCGLKSACSIARGDGRGLRSKDGHPGWVILAKDASNDLEWMGLELAVWRNVASAIEGYLATGCPAAFHAALSEPPDAELLAPFITSVWDLEHRARPYFPEVSVTGWNWRSRDLAYNSVLPRASCVLTGTQAGKTEIVQYYRLNPDNVNVIAFPVLAVVREPQRNSGGNIRDKYGIRGDFLFYPAQFWPHKDHVNLLMALEILRQKRGSKFEVVFVGSDKGRSRSR
jgi:hypothetical protein